MKNIELYREVFGVYPTLNCTVGKESIVCRDEVIDFFVQFNTRITFSRMIGKYGISLEEFRDFLNEAKKYLNVRTGGYDCTMYGGMCGAGMDNIFYANGKVYSVDGKNPAGQLWSSIMKDIHKTKGKAK